MWPYGPDVVHAHERMRPWAHVEALLACLLTLRRLFAALAERRPLPTRFAPLSLAKSSRTDPILLQGVLR